MSTVNNPTVEISRLMADDLVRTVCIIAMSGTPLPPKIVNGKIEHQTGYTARQHEMIVMRCQEMMEKHELSEWVATTKDGDNVTHARGPHGRMDELKDWVKREEPA